MGNNSKSRLRVGVNMATEPLLVPTVFIWINNFFLKPTNVTKQCGLHRHHTLTRREEMCGLQ